MKSCLIRRLANNVSKTCCIRNFISTLFTSLFSSSTPVKLNSLFLWYKCAKKRTQGVLSLEWIKKKKNLFTVVKKLSQKIATEGLTWQLRLYIESYHSDFIVVSSILKVILNSSASARNLRPAGRQPCSVSPDVL